MTLCGPTQAINVQGSAEWRRDPFAEQYALGNENLLPRISGRFGKDDGAFSLELLKRAPFMGELIALGAYEIGQLWQAQKRDQNKP